MQCFFVCKDSEWLRGFILPSFDSKIHFHGEILDEFGIPYVYYFFTPLTLYLIFLLVCTSIVLPVNVCKVALLLANSVDPDQTPRITIHRLQEFMSSQTSRKPSTGYDIKLYGSFKEIQEPQRQETYLWTSALREDSDQPAHLCSLIRIWAHFGIVKDGMFLHVDNEDSNQTARMRRLIWVFVGRTCQKTCFLTLQHVRSMPLDPGHCSSY